jgi:cell division protein FtsB
MWPVSQLLRKSRLSALRHLRNSITLLTLSAVSSLLTRYRLFQLQFNFFLEGWRMTPKNTLATLAVAVFLSLSLTACKDTKTLQENEQLKAQVADLQKENGQLGNNLETLTAARDTLTKENQALKAEIKARKTKRSGTKASSRKRRRS